MARATQPEVYVARSSGIVKIRGKEYRYIKDKTRIAAGHPLLRAMPDRFAPLQLDYDIERATSAEVMET